MINFFTHRILYITTHDVGFGDFLASTPCINLLDKIFDYRCQFHYYINERVYERCGWFLHEHIPCDKVFIHPYENDGGITSYKFQNFKKEYYDYIILSQVYEPYLQDILKKVKCKKILYNNDKNYYESYNLEWVYDYFKEHLSKNENDPTYTKFSRNNQLNKINQLLNGNEFVMLFPFSTRPLASVNLEGISKVIEFSKKKNLKVLIGGENICPYYNQGSNLDKDINNFIEKCKDETVINILGMNLNQTISISKQANYVFYGPTGISMLGILDLINNPNSFLINGGDSMIMEDVFGISQNHISRKFLKLSNKTCPYFPCGNYSENTDIKKIKNCRSTKIALCLNEELEFNI